MSVIFGLGGCKKEYVVGKDIKKEEILQFYFTESSTTNPPYFQRYRIYKEDGNYYYYHEKREGNVVFLTEEHITLSGTLKLTDKQWDTIYSYLEGGTVIPRQEHTESGDSGPFLYLYWDKDKDDIQEFSFETYEKQNEFEKYCIELKKEAK